MDREKEGEWKNTGKTKYFTRIVFLGAFIHKVNVVCIECYKGGEICAVNKVLQCISAKG